MRKLAWVAGGLALLGCAGYVFVYLYRWEWNRAVMMAAFFIAAEVAVATALVLRGLSKLDAERQQAAPPDPAVVARLRDAAPRRDHFAWLGVNGDRVSVFITMVVGGGVLLSGLAWAIDRVAGQTAGRRLEGELAGRLGAIAFPSAGLVANETELLAEEGAEGDTPYEHDPELRLLLGTPGRP